MIGPRTLVALVLAAALGLTHFTAWRYGRGQVRAQWQAERAQAQAAAREAEREARNFEQQRSRHAQEAVNDYIRQTRRAQADAAAAGAELERLRRHLGAAPAGAPGADPAAAVRVDDARALRDVLGRCAGTLAAVAAEADRVEAKLSGLQAWVQGACSNAPPR